MKINIKFNTNTAWSVCELFVKNKNNKIKRKKKTLKKTDFLLRSTRIDTGSSENQNKTTESKIRIKKKDKTTNKCALNG